MFYVLKQKYALNLIKTSFFAFFISIYKKMRKQQNFRYPCNVHERRKNCDGGHKGKGTCVVLALKQTVILAERTVHKGE